jgi:hypothetical protein
MIRLWVFATILQVSNGIAPQARHFRQLSQAQAFTLAKEAQMGDTMRFHGTFPCKLMFHSFLSLFFEGRVNNYLFSATLLKYISGSGALQWFLLSPNQCPPLL